MKNKIVLGNKEFEIKINFRKSYQLTKYRNRMTLGLDITELNKDAIKEIMALQNEIEAGKELDISSLSPEVFKILAKQNENKQELFSFEELIEIGKILTDIENDKELEEIYDIEVQENGFDSLTSKLSLAISTVFMSAKDTSAEK